MRVFIYMFGELMNKLASFLFLPLLAIVMVKDEFGVISILYPFVLGLQGVMALGLSVGFLKGLTDEQSEEGEVVFNVFLCFIVLNLLLFIILWFTLPVWEGCEIGSYLFGQMFFLVWLNGFFLSFLMIFNQIAQSKGLAALFLLFNTLPRVIFVLCVGLWVLFEGISSLEALLIFAVVLFVFVVAACWRLMFLVKLDLNVVMVKTFLWVGLPLALSAAASLVNSMVSRFYLNSIWGVEKVADYSFMLVFSQSCLLFFTTFSRLYIPKLFCFLNIGDQSRVFYRSASAVLVLGGGIAICAIYYSLLLLGPYFYPQYDLDPVVFALMLSAYFPYILYISSVDALSFHKRSHVILLINLFIMLLSAVCGYFAVLSFGLVGAAAIHLVCFWVQGVAVALCSGCYFDVFPVMYNVAIVSSLFIVNALIIKSVPEMLFILPITCVVLMLYYFNLKKTDLLVFMKLVK